MVGSIATNVQKLLLCALNLEARQMKKGKQQLR